jgi:DNA-binding HxlR family transcriptional regulator
MSNRKASSDDIDRIIHEPSRYEIMSVLYVVENTDFVSLLRHTGFSGGNLSTHLKKLQTAGFITLNKEFLNNKPHTSIALTGEGRKAFEYYRELMKQALDTLPEIETEKP